MGPLLTESRRDPDIEEQSRYRKTSYGNSIHYRYVCIYIGVYHLTNQGSVSRTR